METMPDLTRFFHPVLAAEELKAAPVRVLIAGRAYALFRDGDGRPSALLDRCAHRFAPLSKGRVRADGRLACPYHGWHYDAVGRGCNPQQPEMKKCDVPSFQVVERHGYLWMSARETPLEEFPPMEWDGYELAGAFSALFEAPVHVALANFSEDEHLPYVHTRLGWNAGATEKVTFKADNFDDRTEVFYTGPQRPSPLLRFLLVKAGDTFHNRWVTRFDPLRHLYSFHWTDREGTKTRPLRMRTMIFQTPETERTTRFHVFLFLSLRDSKLSITMPLIRRVAVWMAKHEVADDARLTRMMADVPHDMKGMRLDKYDKPVIRNNELLRTLYFGEGRKRAKGDETASVAVAEHPPKPSALAS